ncbi:MAG: thiolase domain-containing protein [Anaerolineales bacterium]
MTAYIVGAYEHPTRFAPDKSVAALHAEVASGALKDAGLSITDVDGYFCAGDAPGIGPMSMVEYLGIRPRYVDSTDIGGGSPIAQVAEAAQAIAAGKCDVALITLAGRPKAEAASPASLTRSREYPENEFELHFMPALVSRYAMCAQRHMYQYGTTSEQLAWIRVAAAHHAQFNPSAVHQSPVTVEDVVSSPLISDPLHRLDCCTISDGGGAVIVVREEIARSVGRPLVSLKGAGVALSYKLGSSFDLTSTAAVQSGSVALNEAGVSPADIRYLSTYDSFTITVLMAIEDLGFCPKGEGGGFVADGKLISGVGTLAVNTDGGGLCNNHPAHRGGVTKIIEAVRQLRCEAHPAVQVPDLALAMAHGCGGTLDQRQGCATIILERE